MKDGAMRVKDIMNAEPGYALKASFRVRKTDALELGDFYAVEADIKMVLADDTERTVYLFNHD